MNSNNKNNQTLYFNGVNGATGGYLFPPQTVTEVAEIAQESLMAQQIDGKSPGDPTSNSHLCALNKRKHRTDEKEFGPIEGIDPKLISETGWGIIFPANIDPQIREALSKLINHRRQEAGEYFQEYEVYSGETANDFLARFGTNVFEPANPQKVPYYLLIVGDFATIPFDFQYQLDVQYAVGRIYFQTPIEYAQYAHSIVEAETTNLSLPCKVNFFGVRNPDDSATELSADRLVKPLSEFFTSNKKFLKKNSHWEIETYLAEQATKAQLSQLLGGEETPALLFTASHGVGFPNQHKRQISHQGALVCQEWPGPEFSGPIPEDFYFSGDDISSSDRLFGLISFHFACYGAGTPKIDQFGHKNNKWEQIAPYPFVANLPQRLLSHPQGGALAFVSHVDRAWGQSFYWQGEEQIGSFQSMLQRLIEGHPIGSALETLNQRYAAVSSELTKELWYIKAGRKSNDSALSYLWTTNNDARGYAIIGDPAVGLMVGNNASKMEKRREINQPVEFSSDLSATISHTTEKDFSSLVELLNSLVQKIEKDQQQHALFDNLIDLLKNLAEKVKQAKTDKNLSEFEKLFKEFAETVKQLEIS